MIVQIYEVINEDEAKKLEELGVDHVGMLVGKGKYPREISCEKARTISNVLKKSKKVVLSISLDEKELQEIIIKTKPDILQIYPKENELSTVKNIIKKFPKLKIMLGIAVIDEKSIDLAREYSKLADYLILDTYKQGDNQTGATGLVHDWGISKKIIEQIKIPVILAGGLGPDNVQEAIKKLKPYGVDSKTRTDLENNQGKDLEKVKQFVLKAKSTKI